MGVLLAHLKEPEPPKGLRDLWDKFPLFRQVLNMAPRVRSGAPCHELVLEANEVDLARLPVQTCWPGDAGPLITWGLTVTRGPSKPRQNLGIYRLQVLGPNRVVMRWLAHRGRAPDFPDSHRTNPGSDFPLRVARARAKPRGHALPRAPWRRGGLPGPPAHSSGIELPRGGGAGRHRHGEVRS